MDGGLAYLLAVAFGTDVTGNVFGHKGWCQLVHAPTEVIGRNTSFKDVYSWILEGLIHMPPLLGTAGFPLLGTYAGQIFLQQADKLLKDGRGQSPDILFSSYIRYLFLLSAMSRASVSILML